GPEGLRAPGALGDLRRHPSAAGLNGPPSRPVSRSGHLVDRAGGGLAWGHADDPPRSSRARLTLVRPYELSSAPLPERLEERLFRARPRVRRDARDGEHTVYRHRPPTETTKEFR